MSQPVTMPKVDRWWLFEHNSDFCGGDTHGDACHSMEQCLELMAKKPHTLPDGRLMAYQYYAPSGKLYNKPIGHNGGSQWRSGSMNLIMWGCSVGHVSNGKTLIRLNGVDVCGGDGKIKNGTTSYEDALNTVKQWNETDTAAFWHAPSRRLILKPKNKGARWTRGDGVLFMWADKPLLGSKLPNSMSGAGKGGEAAGDLEVLEARYGWAVDIWAPEVCSHANGCKDVTSIVRNDICNNELHINPNRQAQYMNQHFWPETARGPPIPRKLAVRYRYGNGAFQTKETPAVPFETVCLDITTCDSDSAATSLDAWVGQKAESFPIGQPAKIVETFDFTREGEIYVTTGSSSGRNTYTRHGDTLVHQQAGEKVTATLQPNGELAWSHGYGSRICGRGVGASGNTDKKKGSMNKIALIVEEIKQIKRTDHYFYRRDLKRATDMLTQAIAKHGRNDLGAIIEELKSLCPTDHYMYRMDKAAAVRLLHQAIESAESKLGSGKWSKHVNIDMCGQGDVEIIGNWRSTHSIDDLKKIVEAKGYSAVCVGSFGHAALKKFDYQLTPQHCKPSQGYTNEIYIYSPGGVLSNSMPGAEKGGEAEILSAQHLSGCWSCACWPGFGGCEYKSAEGDNTLRHTGVCLPFCLPYSDVWDREGQSNTFRKRGANDRLTYNPNSPNFVCFGPGASWRWCGGTKIPNNVYNDNGASKYQTTSRNPDLPPNFVAAQDINGCWGCFCLPGFAACEHKHAEGDNVVWHSGVCLPFCLPYNEAWDREGKSNTFRKRGKDDRVTYNSQCPGFVCFGIGANWRWFKC
jgi:hypothetical protein